MAGKVEVKTIPRPERTLMDQVFVKEVGKGLGLTLKRFFQNTLEAGGDSEIATISYPEEQIQYAERFRGVHRLTQREDGSPRCVACLCCSTACPAQCIHIEPGEYEPEDPRYGYERFPEVFMIDELRCIFCGYCVEACPVDAIRMDTGLHMPPSTKREHFLFDKETLLSIPARDGTYLTGNTRHEPGDASHPGIDREAGGH